MQSYVYSHYLKNIYFLGIGIFAHPHHYSNSVALTIFIGFLVSVKEYQVRTDELRKIICFRNIPR